MIDWIQKNAWVLGVAIIPIIGTWFLWGYRIQQLEADVVEAQQTVNTTNAVLIQVQLSLRGIETDVEYIKRNIDMLTK